MESREEILLLCEIEREAVYRFVTFYLFSHGVVVGSLCGSRHLYLR